MAKKWRKNVRRRNVLIVVLLFATMAGLIVLARLMPANTIPKEPAEVTKRRADRENNGWYTLEQALKQMPVKPVPAWGPMEDDPKTEGQYSAKPDSLGSLLGVKRPDDDPLLLEYVAAAGEILPLVRETLAKPFLLLPTDSPDPRSQSMSKETLLYFQKSWALGNLLVAQAVVASKKPGGSAEAARILRDTFNLVDGLYEASVIQHFYTSPSYAFEVAAHLDPKDQRETLQWALDMQSRERPSRAKIEFDLRQYMGFLDELRHQGSVLHPLEAAEYVRMRGMFLRHFDYAFKTARLYWKEYDQLIEQDEVLRNLGRSGYGFSFFSCAAFNTSWDITMNCLTVILAVELYRHDHGDFPESLEVLVPEYMPKLPDDPSAGHGIPFGYERQPGGYCILNHSDHDKNEFVRKL